MLANSRSGDVLPIERVDRLSRLTEAERRKLRAEINARQVRIVALDLPTSWALAAPADDSTGRVMPATNGMLLDMPTAVARKDFDDREPRAAEGWTKAKAACVYKGRKEDTARKDGIAAMLAAGRPCSQIQAATGCNRAAVAEIAKRDSASGLRGCDARREGPGSPARRGEPSSTASLETGPGSAGKPERSRGEASRTEVGISRQHGEKYGLHWQPDSCGFDRAEMFPSSCIPLSASCLC